MHSHDIRSLAIWPPYSPLALSHQRKFPIDIAPILASGGLDMSVVFTPAALASSSTVSKIVNPLSTSVTSTFEDAYHRRLAYTSGAASTSGVKIAHQARLICCTRDTGLGVWRILPRHDQLMDTQAFEDHSEMGGWEKVLDIDLNVQTNITASAISDDGRWLVVSDLYETRLFVLETDVSCPRASGNLLLISSCRTLATSNQNAYETSRESFRPTYQGKTPSQVAPHSNSHPTHANL